MYDNTSFWAHLGGRSPRYGNYMLWFTISRKPRASSCIAITCSLWTLTTTLWILTTTQGPTNTWCSLTDSSEYMFSFCFYTRSPYIVKQVLESYTFFWCLAARPRYLRHTPFALFSRSLISSGTVSSSTTTKVKIPFIVKNIGLDHLELG